MTGHDEGFSIEELPRLLDPHRVHRLYGGMGDEALAEEICGYYQSVGEDDRRAFESAVLRWLHSEEELRGWQAIWLCGDLKLGACVDALLRQGQMLQGDDPAHSDRACCSLRHL